MFEGRAAEKRNLLEYQLPFLPSHQYFHNKLYNREEFQCHSWLTQNLPLRRIIECSLIHFQRTECQLKPEKPALWSLASRAFPNMHTSYFSLTIYAAQQWIVIIIKINSQVTHVTLFTCPFPWHTGWAKSLDRYCIKCDWQNFKITIIQASPKTKSESLRKGKGSVHSSQLCRAQPGTHVLSWTKGDFRAWREGYILSLKLILRGSFPPGLKKGKRDFPDRLDLA